MHDMNLGPEGKQEDDALQGLSAAARAAMKKHMESLDPCAKAALISNIENPPPPTKMEIASEGRRDIRLGIVLIIAGTVITFASYWKAAETGGAYYYVYGPIALGVVLLTNGISKREKARKKE